MLAARAACRRVQQQPAHAASRWSPLTGSVGLLRSPAAPTSAPRRHL
eukprot:COSAG02_NODE_50947_length_317_cov_0.912844_1_plen_46_part_10